MNKKKLIALIIIVLVIIGIIFIVKGNIDKSKRDYDVEVITDYNYFLMFENGKNGIINNNGDGSQDEPILHEAWNLGK